jgi:hypothetical protein
VRTGILPAGLEAVADQDEANSLARAHT